jgi:hypothetical protein
MKLKIAEAHLANGDVELFFEESKGTVLLLYCYKTYI